MMKVPGLQVGRIKWMTLMILDGPNHGMDTSGEISSMPSRRFIIRSLMMGIISWEILILPIQLTLIVKVPVFLRESEYWSGNKS